MNDPAPSRLEGAAPPAAARPVPVARPIGAVNWRGLWTLYVRESRRFFRDFVEMGLGAAATSLLYLAVFELALGGETAWVGGLSLTAFVAPGLIMLSIAQAAFMQDAFAILFAKIEGFIVDVLMPPLGAFELTCAYALAGVTGALATGVTVAAGVALIAPLGVHDPVLLAFHALTAPLMLSLFGMAVGIWAVKWDHLAAVMSLFVVPVVFLSGTFYSVLDLPEAGRVLVMLNPVFYAIDGFRYGMTGHADGSLGIGIVVVLATTAALWALCHRLFATGYRLRN